jgi:hypothetical protein
MKQAACSFEPCFKIHKPRRTRRYTKEVRRCYSFVGFRGDSLRNRARVRRMERTVCYNLGSPPGRYRLGVRTEDSQSSNPGSIPGSATKSLHVQFRVRSFATLRISAAGSRFAHAGKAPQVRFPVALPAFIARCVLLLSLTITSVLSNRQESRHRECRTLLSVGETSTKCQTESRARLDCAKKELDVVAKRLG